VEGRASEFESAPGRGFGIRPELCTLDQFDPTDATHVSRKSESKRSPTSARGSPMNEPEIRDLDEEILPEISPACSARKASWSAAIVNHGDYDGLRECLASISEQRCAPDRICVYDTGVDASEFHVLRAAHPGVDFEVGPNLGYAAASNRVLAKLSDSPTALGFALLLNSDVVLDPPFAECLVEAMAARSEVAIAGGKLLRPGREILDSTGIEFPRNRRPRDRGSEEPDSGRYDRSEVVEGVSGAAMMLRMEALPGLAIDGEIFDEDFFAYHEDTDLCWRSRRLGWSIWYEPTAVAVHRRGWRKAARARIPIEIRRHSFKNHYLQIAKNERGRDLLLNLPWLIGWEMLRLGFVLLREPALMAGYVNAMGYLGAALRKRRRLSSMSSAPPRRVAG
jgi:GT2 family glycosyltransferase